MSAIAPTPQPSMANERLVFILDYLRSAADGRELGRNISEAFYRVECYGDRTVPPADADAIWEAAIGAATRACEGLPPWVPRSHIRQGFKALLAWIELRREDVSDRFVETVGQGDIRNLMRVLRNHAHNVALLDEMAERRAGGETAR